jgi:LysM repeat protein
MMQFSWKKSVFTLIAGLLITGCATSSRQSTQKPILMGARGGIVPQPYLEPIAPSPLDVQPPMVEPVITVPVQPIAPPLAVESTKPITPIYKAPSRSKVPSISVNELEKYIVVKGDTLSEIAYRYKGLSYLELARFNNLELKKPLSIGQVLLIPAKGEKKLQKLATPKVPKTTAKRKTTVNQNRGKKPIPANGKYVVKSGDSLWLIGHRYGISTKELKQLNKLKSDNLHIGDVLVLKDGVPATTVENVSKPDIKTKKDSKDEKVQPLTPVNPSVPVGGNEEVISVNNGLSVDSQELDVIVGRDGVPSTLKEIAEMYSVKEEDITKANPDVDFSHLEIGQKLKFSITE